MRSQPAEKTAAVACGIVPVAADHVRALHAEFADAARWHRIPEGIDDPHLADRQGRPAGIGMGQVILALVVGEGRRGLGHAPAGAGDDLGQDRAQRPHEVAGGRRAAVGDRIEAGQAPARLPGRGGELPRDGRHPARAGAALRLDQVEGLVRVPAMHHDEPMAAVERRAETGVAAGDVEQRDHQQRHPLRRGRIGLRRRLAPAQAGAGGRVGIGHHRGGGRPVGADRALGLCRWCPRCRTGSRRPPGRGRGRGGAHRAGCPTSAPGRSRRRAGAPGDRAASGW